jgi:hypothetical protein
LEGRQGEGRQGTRQHGTARREDDDEDNVSDRGSSDEAAASPDAVPDLSRVLQEQISQALQPTLAEFREQMSASVRRELDETLDADRRRGRQQPHDRGATESEAPADTDADRSTDDARSPGSGPSRARGSNVIGSWLGKPLLEALPGILEEQGEQWLRTRLDLGIDFLFAAWMRAAIQHDVERVLQGVTRVATGFISDRAAREDLRAQADRTVERLVGTALDTLFADDVRDDLRARGHRAIDALFEPDLKSIIHQAQDLLVSLLDGLLAVLRACWEQILQLLGKVVLALLQPRLTAMLKDAFASLTTTSGRGEEQADRASEADTDEGDTESHRARSAPADDDPREEPTESDRPRRRGRDIEAVADKSDERAEHRPGRAPSGRPTASRQASGRSGSDRAASGRSSRAASR